MDEDILKRIVMTPAERALLCEQAETLKVLLDTFESNVLSSDNRALVMTWAEMGHVVDYMSNVLQAKTNRALHNAMLDRGEE